MSPQQKYAAFNLAVAIVAMAAYFALLPFIGPWRAAGAFGVLGLCGVSGWVLYRANRTGRVVSDEREQFIWQRATLVAKSVVWVGLIAAFLVAPQTLAIVGRSRCSCSGWASGGRSASSCWCSLRFTCSSPPANSCRRWPIRH